MWVRKPRSWAFTLLGILFSLLLLYYAYGLHLIRQANALLQERHISEAAAQYERAVRWTLPLVPRLPAVREPLRQGLVKQAQILALQSDRDAALEFFQTLPSAYPFLENDWEYHLWYGNALFFRGIFQEEPEALLTDLQAAAREYQRALELNPVSWDARFNFELIKRALLAEGDAGRQQLQLLQEERREKRRDDELPPEKVG